MTRPLSNDLRERVIGVVGGGAFEAGGRGAVWDCGCDGGALGPELAGERFNSAPASGWRPALASDRSARRRAAFARCEDAGHHAAGTRRAPPQGAWPARRGIDGLAIPRPPRHDLQKKPRTPASSKGLMYWPGGAPGSPPSPIWTPSVWSSSMRPAPPPKWRGCAGGRCAASVAGRPFLTVTGRRRPLSAASACRA